MPDTTPISTEAALAIMNAQLRRVWQFTYVSIGLNVLILAVFLVCAIASHHRHNKHGFARGGGWGRGGGHCMMQWGGRGGFGGGHGFRHGGMGMQGGWGKHGGFNGPRPPMGFQNKGGWDGPGSMGMGGPGMRGDRGPGMGGPGGGGFGMRGMMGGGENAPDPAKVTDMVLGRLSTQLNLTDDQKAKMKPIIQDQVTQMQKDMEARRQAMQKAMDDTKAKLKTLLNADQQKQLDAIPLPGQKPAAAAGATAPTGK